MSQECRCSELKLECDKAYERAFKAEAALAEIRDREFLATATLQRFMNWLAGKDPKFSKLILQCRDEKRASGQSRERR